MSEEARKLNSLEEDTFLLPIPSTVSPPPPVEVYLPMLQGAATNKLRETATRNISIDRNGNATIEREGFKAFFRDYAKLKGGLTTGAKKMLDAGALQLTAINHYRTKPGQQVNTAVSIPLEEYGRLRGYDLTPRNTSTPEEETAEKKRLDNLKRDIRKRANAELATLFSISLSWTEPGSKKLKDYSDIRILQSKGIRGGYINMRFTEDIAAYLTHAYVMQYPKALQSVDEYSPRAYNVGYKLALHNSIDNNRAKGTANIISVASLLEACGDIPTFDEVQASSDRGHWERRIKTPLEAALDNCTENGVITEWEYANSKGAPLECGQVDIADYQTFSKLYIKFGIEAEPDQSERLRRKAERIEAAKKRKPHKKAASKNKGSEAEA